MLRRSLLALVAGAMLAPAAPAAFATVSSGPSTPALIGDWNFASGSGLDTTGNWTNFQLHGEAAITNGQLVVAGPTAPTNYAQATAWAEASGYKGSDIADKTMISWVKLDATSPTGGSPISLFNLPGGYKFDAVDYGEVGGNQWVAGSDGGWRSGQFPSNVSDTDTSSLRQVAISYHGNGDGSQTITGCLNGVDLGSYRTGTTTFDNSTQVLFGPRHEGLDGYGNLVPVGAIDAHITESRLYNGALTCSQVNALNDTTPPVLQGMPTDQTVNATSSSGATASWTAPTATDNMDPNPTVSCSPLSGSTFAIGDTTVACTATDAAGNPSTATFNVHVAGAPEQLAALAAAVAGFGPGRSLAHQVAAVQSDLAAGNAAMALDDLQTFASHVAAQAGKSITRTQAAAWQAAATQIANVIA